jgi:hypothetical protein
VVAGLEIKVRIDTDLGVRLCEFLPPLHLSCQTFSNFKLDLHLEGRKLVKFQSDIRVVNIFLAGVIWLKILGTF